ncbi:hypothetical protein QQ045_000335 [Rhodiola kirilowii]
MAEVLGLKPRVEHYTCMVDLLGRAGLLTEAEDLILNMSIKPDDVIWKALLGACKTHGNVEMGERVASRIWPLVIVDSMLLSRTCMPLQDVGMKLRKSG